MDKFTIYQLEQISGIKSHTIRMWENRYNALHPERSNGNIRYYSGEQLRRLLNIVALQKSGYKIAQLSKSTNSELDNLILENFVYTDKSADDFTSIRNQLIGASATFNEAVFNIYFDKCVHNYGLVHTYQNIIYPLLQQVGLLWCSKQIPVSQEHFLSHLILQKLYAAIEQLPEKPNSTDTWLLFLPENEFHIIGLLISSYILQSRGKKVIFIGANTPESIINNIIDTVQITHVLFFKILHTQPDTLENYLKNIVKICKTQKIHIAANNEVLNQINNQKVIKLYSIKQLIEGVY